MGAVGVLRLKLAKARHYSLCTHILSEMVKALRLALTESTAPHPTSPFHPTPIFPGLDPGPTDGSTRVEGCNRPRVFARGRSGWGEGEGDERVVEMVRVVVAVVQPACAGCAPPSPPSPLRGGIEGGGGQQARSGG